MKPCWASSMPTPWKDLPRCQSEVCNNRMFLSYPRVLTVLRHRHGRSGKLLSALAVEEVAGVVGFRPFRSLRRGVGGVGLAVQLLRAAAKVAVEVVVKVVVEVVVGVQRGVVAGVRSRRQGRGLGEASEHKAGDGRANH